MCSAHEVADLKRFFGDRLFDAHAGDSPHWKRARRSEARHDAGRGRGCGLGYIVVGRPIVEAEDPVAATRAILEEMRVRV